MCVDGGGQGHKLYDSVTEKYLKITSEHFMDSHDSTIFSLDGQSYYIIMSGTTEVDHLRHEVDTLR